MIDKKENNGVWKYFWTAGGMLKAVQRPDGSVISFKYDAFGRRIEKKNARATTHFVWDGNVPLHEWKTFDYQETTDNDRITWVFQDFVPVAKLQGDKSYSIISDHLGTPLMAIDTNGVKVWERELDIYGKVRKLQGDKWFMPFLYQGQYYDNEVDLCYNRFRYYDCNTGTYISQDPIGLAGGNPTIYGYVKDPNTWLDVFGLNDKHISRQIKDVDAINDINRHLGGVPTTNIHPGKGTIDNNRIFAQQPDGSWHAVRIGNHEIKNDIGKGFHYHLEKFDANGNFIGPDEQVYVTKSKARGGKSS